jgi:hypothetical protein
MKKYLCIQKQNRMKEYSIKLVKLQNKKIIENWRTDLVQQIEKFN